MSLRDQLQHTLGTSYRLERELGGGGMSRVFVAEETALGRRVVVKVLPPEVVAGVNADRFKREIQVAARLQHPHIVPVLSAGEMQGVPYYTMPFVDGESVRARLIRGPLSITEAIGILRDVAKALAYAHHNGIVHRDIKPDNILLSGGSATVTDFGIAKAIAAARSHGDGDHPATLTQIGSSIGTPAYMAPEQAAADPTTNHRADIYAFGCTAYELLAGRPPFIEKSPQRLLAAHMGDTPQPVAALRPDTPAVLAELVMRCLEKDPDARPQNASDVVQVLETVTSGGSHAPMPSVLLAGKGMLAKALGAYAAAFVFVAVLAKAAIVGVGLPDWVFPGAIVVMLLGLPVILFTAYVHRTTRRLLTQTPTYTPGGSVSPTHGTMATFAMKASPHVSWRRTWLGGVAAVGAFIVLIGAYMGLRAAGIGPFGSLISTGALQKNEKLLVADFNSSTSDTSIAPVVTDAFRTALGQSRTMSVMEPTELREVLRRMQKPAGTRVDFPVAREIATREGIKAVVLGDVIGIGGNYAVSVRLMSPQAEELARFRVTAKGDEELLPAIDKLARDLRAKIGESLRSVQATPALERVTTPSLEALRKYVQGSRMMSGGGDFTKGAALLEEAIALDTGFAMAYRRLAAEYSNRQQPDRAMALLAKAYEHRSRLSDAERYLVLGSYYYRGPEQDLARAASAYETLLEIQPDNYTALNNVAIIYRWTRNWSKAENVLRRSIATGFAPVVTYNQLGWVLWNQGKRDEAWRLMAAYDSAYPNTTQRLARRGELLYSAGQYDSVSAMITRTLSGGDQLDPVARSMWMGFSAGVARTRGRLAQARERGRESTQIAVQNGRPQARLEEVAVQAMETALLVENRARADRMLDEALAATPVESLPPASRPYVELSMAYALAGDPSAIGPLLRSFDQSRRGMVRYQDQVDRAMIEGSSAFAAGRYAEATRAFRSSSEQGDCMVCALPLLAMSHDRAGEPDSALAVLERYVTTQDVWRFIPDVVFLAPAHRRLGELYEAKGDVAKAHRHYATFVDLWKNADAELQPRVAEARRRMSRLADAEPRARQN